MIETLNTAALILVVGSFTALVIWLRYDQWRSNRAGKDGIGQMLHQPGVADIDFETPPRNDKARSAELD